MRSAFLIVLFFLVAPYSFSQSTEDPIFLTIGTQHVSIGEFDRIYNKNNSLSTTDKQTVDEYLQMFINFKLKVQAAMDAGCDTLSSFKSELKGYRDQLAKSYLTDNSAVEELIMEAYQRMHTEVNASHIMVALNISATPKDTLEAWNKIMAIRERVINGEPFDKLALELSDDPSAKNNRGNLGYFTAFQMVYPFESAAFNTKIGDISQPVRSRFGYHIVKTLDKRPARGEVKVAHIMFMVPQGSNDSAWISAENKIKELAKQLKEGADFASLAKEKSEDRGSARNGGELPAFGTGRMVPEFEQAAFKLVAPGDISEPVRTLYGWHIIKLLEKKGIPELEKVKQDLKSKIARDERAEAGSNSFVTGLKKEYGFSENTGLLAAYYQVPPPVEQVASKSSTGKGKQGMKKTIASPQTDYQVSSPVEKVSSKSSAGKEKPWMKKTIASQQTNKQPAVLNLNINNDLETKELFSFNGQSYQMAGFRDYLKSLPAPDSTVTADQFVKKAYATYVKSTLLEYENNQLEKKHSDFKNLIHEYHDGILLFNLSDSLIWSKASKDTAGLQTFYQNNQTSYNWPERLEAMIVNCKLPSIAQKAIKITRKLKSPEKIESQLMKAVCDSITGENCLSLAYNKYSRGDHPVIDSIFWKKGTTPITTKDGTSQFVVVFGKIAPSPKTLDEARGLVISDYQTFLENKWVEQLRKKYKIVVNNETLNQLKNKYAGKN